MRTGLVWTALWLAGCPAPGATDPPVDTDTDTQTDTDTDTDTDTTDPLAPFRLAPPVEADGVHGATHVVCTECHTASEASGALRDASGRAIGPADLWPGSMMAHSARDPIFLTAVAAERAATPSLGDAIDRKCLACHSPAAWADATLEGSPGPTVADLRSDSLTGDLARDGATCVGCHLQTAESLGAESTWSGRHPLNPDRELYGPHRSPFAGPMRNRAGFEPTVGDHVQDSTLCASCHTLEVSTVDAEGIATGHTVMEQGPFVEWRASAYNPENGQPQAARCQTCHMSEFDEDGVAIRTRIARSPAGTDYPRTYTREPVARHALIGGNTFALELIRDNRELLGSPATEAQLTTSLAATRAKLGEAARVEVGPATWSDSEASFEVRVDNLTGHKLPTGFPARRVWLELELVDADGQTVWHVGDTDGDGRLLGDAGEALTSESPGAGLLPHRDRITRPDEVVVWQAALVDPDGDPTDVFLQAAAYGKDNRLLPIGFAPTEADASRIGPVGTEGDASFSPGSDTVRVELSPSGRAPWTVHARVRYQAISPRYLSALLATDTPESRALGLLLQDRTPPTETLATAERTLDRP